MWILEKALWRDILFLWESDAADNFNYALAPRPQQLAVGKGHCKYTKAEEKRKLNQELAENT